MQSGFLGSLQERERIVSTMLGTASLCPTPSACWRAAPWSIPCWPPGIDWGNGESATLIFVLAIAKAGL